MDISDISPTHEDTTTTTQPYPHPHLSSPHPSPPLQSPSTDSHPRLATTATRGQKLATMATRSRDDGHERSRRRPRAVAATDDGHSHQGGGPPHRGSQASSRSSHYPLLRPSRTEGFRSLGLGFLAWLGLGAILGDPGSKGVSGNECPRRTHIDRLIPEA